MHPLTVQCSAKSKRSGERCRRLVTGATVCAMHGKSARQVKAAAESRIAAHDAMAAGAALEGRPAHDALADAATTADQVARQLRSQLGDGNPDPRLLEVLGPWLDRVGRLARSVADLGLDERRVRLVEAQRLQAIAVLREALRILGLDADDAAVVAAVRTAGERLGGREVVAGELAGPAS